MKTSKGTTYSSLLAMNITDNVLTVRIPLQQNLLGDISQEYIDKAIPFISERIISGVKPAATFEKELQRIEDHQRLLRDAYLNLFTSYSYVTTPQKRQSPKDKVAYDMLSAMPDKMLREYARMYLSDAVDEYILPDERERLIEAAIDAMKVQSNAVQSNGKGE